MQKLELITQLILNRLANERQLRERQYELDEPNPRDGAEKQDRNPASRDKLAVVLIQW